MVVVSLFHIHNDMGSHTPAAMVVFQKKLTYFLKI